MGLIFLSLLAVIGILLGSVALFDYFYYRNRAYSIKTSLSFVSAEDESILEVLEAIATVRKSAAGRAVINDVVIRLQRGTKRHRDEMYRLMRVYDLPGEVILDEKDQNTAENDTEYCSFHS